jgi:pimeloyl-ACP methyl ester carboxylesterase
MRVVLIGWGNATTAQLVAYERLYGTFGLSARSVIPRTRSGLLDPDAYKHSLAPVAAEIDADPEPVLFHLFSDNGFIGWAALLERLASKHVIRGVIQDSSPGLWNVKSKREFARRFALGMTPTVARAMGLGVRERMPVLTPVLGALFVAYQVVFPRSVRTMVGAADRVAERQPRCPHLFLYGGADVLVPPADVRAWIARQRARGIPVTEELFENARHVALYPADPRRYREAIARFVERVRAVDRADDQA